MSIYKACDIRGIVPDEWNATKAHHIGRALGSMLRQRQQTSMCVAGDFRRSTPALIEALTLGLVESGIEVIQLGQVPTPAAYFGAHHLACPNVAIVTASHNPGRYNGIKFLIAGHPAVPAVIHELQQQLNAPEPVVQQHATRSVSIESEYEDWLQTASQSFIECESSPSFKVVVDTMGGACTQLAPRVLRRAGHVVSSEDDQLDPDFSRRDPNPAVDQNLAPLRRSVTELHADLGIALDGDGDRVLFIDAHGEIARPEQIAALLVRHHFRQCTLVYDLKCASIVAEAVRADGGRAIMQPSGHGFIKQTMLRESADIGVEVSGHHFFGKLHGGDDGLFTALVLLRLLGKTRQPLHQLLQPIGWPAITPDIRIRFQGETTTALDAIAATCGGTISRLDGVRAEYASGEWGLARASITEPAITFRFEAIDKRRLPSIIARFLNGASDLHQLVMEKLHV